MPKYVVSSTLSDPTWHNTCVLGSDVATQLAALKREVAGELQVAAASRSRRR